MAVTVDDFAAHLGFAETPADTTALQRPLDAATATIVPHVTEPAPTPEQVQALDLAVLTVAGDLWRRKDSFGGTYAFSDGADMVGVLPRDQLNSVWPLLMESGLVSIVVA